MLFKTSIAVLYSTLVTGALGNLEAPIPGYEVVIPQWEIEVFPGEAPVVLNGTVEEVMHEIGNLNPDLADSIHAEAVADMEAMAANIGTEATDALQKRTDFHGSKTICGGGSYGWRSCRDATIQSGISYLRKLKGRPGASPGPGACGRVSCSYDAAIWWCNDDNKPKTLESWGSIADGASWLSVRCSYQPTITSFLYVVGQVFHPTHWNVIVRKDSC